RQNVTKVGMGAAFSTISCQKMGIYSDFMSFSFDIVCVVWHNDAEIATVFRMKRSPSEGRGEPWNGR
ncbi:MAG: hypothetical protein IJG25_07665, partial [Thermoguttaceae bacterium]|nr:hypothetical protein [Thermoguttaceae bacterium]